jgi:hypothetical protein
MARKCDSQTYASSERRWTSRPARAGVPGTPRFWRDWGRAVHRCDNWLIFMRLQRLQKTHVSFQGIALATPQAFRNQTPL